LLVPIDVALGPALRDELLPAHGPSPLLERWLPEVRERIFSESGIPLPAIEVRAAGAGAAARGYTIRLHEMPVAQGTVDAADAPADERLAEQLYRVLRQHGHRLVGIQETQTLLDNLERTHPALVREVVPKLATPVLLADVLARLAREGISLRYLADILTALAQRGLGEADAAILAERVRAALPRQLTHLHAAADGHVAVYFVDATIEETLREAIAKTDAGSHLALPPELARDIVQAVKRQVAGVARPVILTSPDIRRHLRGLLEPEQPEVAVLAYPELLPEARLETLGHITVEAKERAEGAENAE
jgi:type III secretory pathway component EscV